MNGLLTDLYELTMSAGYFVSGKWEEQATFELFIRRLPRNRNYVVAAGLDQAVESLLSLSFDDSSIGYLRGLRQFRTAPPDFFDALRRLRFEGDVDAVPEGTVLFAGEPMLRVRASLPDDRLDLALREICSTFGLRQLTQALHDGRRAHRPAAARRR